MPNYPDNVVVVAEHKAANNKDAGVTQGQKLQLTTPKNLFWHLNCQLLPKLKCLR
jgi:hypothetical protein